MRTFITYKQLCIVKRSDEMRMRKTENMSDTRDMRIAYKNLVRMFSQVPVYFFLFSKFPSTYLIEYYVIGLHQNDDQKRIPCLTSLRRCEEDRKEFNFVNIRVKFPPPCIIIHTNPTFRLCRINYNSYNTSRKSLQIPQHKNVLRYKSKPPCIQNLVIRWKFPL